MMHVHDIMAMVTGFGVGAATDGALAPSIMQTAMVGTVTEEFRAALAAVVPSPPRLGPFRSKKYADLAPATSVEPACGCSVCM